MSQKLEYVRCPECGRQLPPSHLFCFCGHNLQTPPISLPLSGIRGWLLFFCLQLIVLNPLGIGLLVINERRALHANEMLRSALGPMIGVDSGVRMGLVAIGVAGGVLLVVRNRLAVPFIRVYLVLFAVAHIALTRLPWSFGLPRPMRDPIVAALIYRAVVLTVPWVAFWLFYFKYSERVKLTYSEIPPQTEMLVENSEASAQALKQAKRSAPVTPDAAREVLEPSRNAAPASRTDVIIQITAHKSGAVSVNGQRVDLDLLGKALDDLKRREGEIWYYGRKETPDQEPPSTAAKVGARVLEAIMDRGLPVRFMGDE